MTGFDDTDIALLDVLKQNGRLSTRQLSLKTKIPVATVNRRLKHLIDSGVITGFSANIDYDKLGVKTEAYVLIRLTPGADQTDLMDVARKRPEVVEVAAIAGQFDTLIKIRVKDTDALSEFLYTQVRNFPAVAQTETFLVLNLKYQNRKRATPS
jgi:DNA-binding Lrp family transcriptional regulator